MKRIVFVLVTLAASVSLSAQILEKHPSEDFRIGVAGYSYRKFSIDGTLAQLKKMGVHYLSVKDFWLPLTASEEEMKAFKEKCASYDVEGYILGPIYMHSKYDAGAAFPDIHIKDESAPSKSGWTWEMGRGVLDAVCLPE